MVSPNRHNAFHLYESNLSGINHQEINLFGDVAYSINSDKRLGTKALKLLIMSYMDESSLLFSAVSITSVS